MPTLVILKYIIGTLRISLLDGSIMAVFGGVIAEPFFPKTIRDYWSIWWISWLIALPLFYLVWKKR